MGRTKLPATCGDVTVLELGQVNSKPGFHDREMVYPVGFKTSRRHLSMVDPSAKCIYESEILEEGGKPVFRVTCEHDKDNPIEDSTADSVWSIVLERIASLTRRSSRAAAGGANTSEGRGMELFGLTNDKVRKLVMDLPGVSACKQLKQNERSGGGAAAGREGRGMAKAEKEGRAERTSRRQLEEEEERERERVQRSSSKAKKGDGRKGKGKKEKDDRYVQPPEMEHLELGEWRCMDEDIEILPAGSESSVVVDSGRRDDESALLRIWEVAAVNHFLRCFRAPLGLTSLTSEDFHAAFLECNSAMKIIHLRLMLKPADRKKAPELADGDEWLEMLRKKLREQQSYWDPETGMYEKTLPLWQEILEEDPMPESIHQYFALSVRKRALIIWALCERLLDVDEDGRLVSFPNLDWDDADALRMFPQCHDSKQNAYWYFEGSNGILYKESKAREGRRVQAPRFEAVATSHEELEEVGKALLAEGKKKKIPKLASFGKWLVEDEAPKLASKAQARERAKSRQAMLELMPRKRSSRIVDKEEKEKEEAERRRIQREEEEMVRAEKERKRKEREREDRIREREEALVRQQREAEKEKAMLEQERERRLRKRRRLLQRSAMAEGGYEDGDGRGPERPQRSSQRLQSDSKWWDVGKSVEVYYDGDWWQAVVVKTQKGLVPGEDEILVSYVGGNEEENEWVRVKEGRARPPSDSWDEERDGGGSSDDDDDLSDLDSSAPSENGARHEEAMMVEANGKGSAMDSDDAHNGREGSSREHSREVEERKAEMAMRNQQLKMQHGSLGMAAASHGADSVQRQWEAMKPEGMSNGVHERGQLFSAAQAGGPVAMNGGASNGQAWPQNNHGVPGGMVDALAGRGVQLPALQGQFAQHGGQLQQMCGGEGGSRALLAPAMLTGQAGMGALSSLPLQKAQMLHSAQLQALQPATAQLPPMLPPMGAPSAMAGQVLPQASFSAGMVNLPLGGADSRPQFWEAARRT